MAEESKKIDPDATVTQPLSALDPDATITQQLAAVDPDTTISGPLVKPEPDAEATDRLPAFDPDATFNPAGRVKLDPEATVRIPGIARMRKNPFAPKSALDSIPAANLSSLGGLNQLVALANPILAAVPQIRQALRHPDPGHLRESLRAQIESLEVSAFSAEISDDTLSVAVYALCALLDESAAATPWGRDWIQKGLLQAMRGETGGAEGFFARLDQVMAEPEKNADLLEFFYVCLALGFQGRYRDAKDGRQALAELKDVLYGLITRRRPRPDALSEHWRTPTTEALAEAALATAARANAARAAAEAAARAAEETVPPRPARGFALSRLPRRAIWSAVGGIVGATIVLYLLGLRLQENQTQTALSAKPSRVTADSGAPGAAPVPAAGTPAGLAKAFEGIPVKLGEAGGSATIELSHDRQFAPGGAQPAAETQATLRKVAAALDKLPGTILVVGHADATPAGTRYASNAELSAARAAAAARLMAPALSDAKRLASEGRGDAEPVAPNDTGPNRARNRRVTIVLKP